MNKKPGNPIDCSIEAIADDQPSGLASNLLPTSVSPPSVETLTSWFQCLTALQNSVASTQEFFQKAAEAVCQPGGLDGAGIILPNDGEGGSTDSENWKFVALHSQCTTPNPTFRPELLQIVMSNGQTIFHNTEKLEHVEERPSTSTVAVSPVKNESGQIAGFLYGWREQTDQNKRYGIRALEAHFVQLVSQAIAANLIRKRREADIAQKNTLLSQAFPAKVVERLESEPSIFEGRDKVVSTMFVDLRGFSKISNRLAPNVTYQMIVDIMDLWTEIVIDNSGAVVDYFGDGLVAFWNAPLDIENHASLAVTCAKRIRDNLQVVNETWRPVAGCQIDAGIGIATGIAQVGNCGSRHRFKYGPHGPNVNLAARLEKLTRELAGSILISEATAAEIQADYFVRRICKARVNGFDNLVNVYEAIDADSYTEVNKIQEYEQALEKFESGQLSAATDLMEQFQSRFPDDAAGQMLLKNLKVAARPERRGLQDQATFLRLID